MGSALVMTEFKRSPSKVWWGNETSEWREVSASPGSQDSGFSDTETTPQQNIKNSDTPTKSTPTQRIPKDIFKELASEKSKQNHASNFVEKSTPEKSNLLGRLAKTSPKKERDKMAPNTEPARKCRFTKNSPKVSRNLFTSSLRQKECKTHQYAEAVRNETSSTKTLDTSEEVTVDDSYSWRSDDAESSRREESYVTHSLPAAGDSPRKGSPPRNRTAPAVLGEHEAATRFNNSLSSDCESELECLFNEPVDSPKHTSTPKAEDDAAGRMGQRRERLPLRLFLRYQHDRVPPIPTIGSDEDNAAVEKWMEEARRTYEQECMTTLQCKSIAGELNQKVSHLAASSTAAIRAVISHSRCIEMEYRNLNNGEMKHMNPQVQSLTGNIVDFLKTHTSALSPQTMALCDAIRASKSDGDATLELISNLVAQWQNARQDVLAEHVERLVARLEHPSSELDLRATVTGITSVALRNEEVVELFTRSDIIPILLILCEKCEGSSLRTLVLRALATMCSSSSAVRQFEKFSGVQIVADTLEEPSTPEPERSEAVALLAQVTAPWLEDNHSVKGLQEYSRKLVKALTKFAASTKCCQNLLLCTAALANLSTMDPKAMKYLIRNNTAASLLEAVKARGPRASIYLLEQLATLVANMSASEDGRKQLTDVEAPKALLHFLGAKFAGGEEVEKRLQQKSIIALSRLCGEKEAARQVVDHRGVERLVRMCREKAERYDSDAVLVAALATLRKIAGTCGSDVLSALDAQELVEPKLLDSFLAYSTQNESYV